MSFPISAEPVRPEEAARSRRIAQIEAREQSDVARVVHEIAADHVVSVADATFLDAIRVEHDARVFDAPGTEDDRARPDGGALVRRTRDLDGLEARTCRVRVQVRDSGVEEDAEVRVLAR